MSDLSDVNAAGITRLTGSDATGIEQTPVQSTSAGGLHVNLRNNAGTESGILTNPIYVIESADETYSLLALDVAFATNKSMVSLLNSGSKVLRIKSIKMINSQNAAVTGVVAEFSIKRITGFTGGTALTPETFDLNDTLASVTAATGATVSGEAASQLLRYSWSTDEWGVGTSDVESTDHTSQSLLNIYETKNGVKSITLRNGQGLTIKNITTTAVSTFDFEIIFTLGVV